MGEVIERKITMLVAGKVSDNGNVYTEEALKGSGDDYPIIIADAMKVPKNLLGLPREKKMKITEVSYSRLVSMPDYENRKIGATATVEDGETAEEALDALREWVEGRLVGTEGPSRIGQIRELREAISRMEEEIEMNRQRKASHKLADMKARLCRLTEGREGEEDMPF